MSRVGGGSRYYDDRDIDYYSSNGRGREREYEEVDYRRRPERERPRVVEDERVVLDERVRARDPPPAFLREDYGKTTSGPMVLRARESEDWEFRPREREPPREVVREEYIERRPEPRPREVEREREVYERDELAFRRGRGDRDRDVYERDYEDLRDVRGGRGGRGFESRSEIDIRRLESHSRPRGYDRDFEEDIKIRRDERDRGRGFVDRDVSRDELVIRRDERDRPPPPRDIDRSYERDDILISRREGRDRPREVDRDYERDDILISRREGRDRPREVDRDYERDDFFIRRGERDRPRDYEREREYTKSRPPSRSQSREREEIIIRNDQRDGGRGGPSDSRQEIVIRKEKSSRSPSPPSPILAPEPPIVRAPPIHQEVITHHRHIDHGFEVVSPPRRAHTPEPRAPPREEADESIEIRRRGENNGRAYDDQVLIERRERERERDDLSMRTRRSPSPDFPNLPLGPPRRFRDPRDERDVREEAEYYKRKMAERAYMGEAYNGATKDWALVDVPPGTKRVTMDGIGGASEELSWERYNGMRRSRFNAEGEEYGGNMELGRPHAGGSDIIGRRYEGVKDPRARLWTEITKDLVSKEAIEMAKYEYEETDMFYYIFAYMDYRDVSRLVDLSEELRARRRERVAQLEWEQRDPRLRLEAVPAVPEREPLMLPPPPPTPPRPRPWEEEIVREREVIYDRRPPPPPGRYY